MKVILFAQIGDARPKCVGSVAQGGPSGAKFIDRGGSCYLSDYQSFMLDNADLWWLVECPDAEMGRMIINSAPCDDSRILASGGK